jgi:hypothetical protein
MNMTVAATDTAEALRMFKILGNPTFEIRTLPPPVTRGYFNDPEQAAASATRQSDSGRNVYVTINELKAGFSFDGVIGSGLATGNTHIERRTNLYLDIDPQRAEKGGAATEAEHQSALDTARKAAELAASRGWPEPMLMDSGNGAAAIFRIGLPNTPETTKVLKAVLAEFAAKLNNDQAHVDKSVYDAPRIARLPGTVNRKGAHTDERPHRMARIISAPEGDKLEAVTEEQLRSFAGNPITESVAQLSFPDLGSPELQATQVDAVKRYLVSVGIAPCAVHEQGDSKVVDLPHCTRRDDGDNTDGHAGVLVALDGTIGYKCFHDTCKDVDWRAFQKHYEKSFYEFATCDSPVLVDP